MTSPPAPEARPLAERIEAARAELGGRAYPRTIMPMPKYLRPEQGCAVGSRLYERRIEWMSKPPSKREVEAYLKALAEDTGSQDG